MSLTPSKEKDPFAYILFRSVRVRNVSKTLHEDFALLLAKKCGEIEQWRSTEKELTVAFRNVNSISSALALDGLKYDNQTVIIWRGSTDTPAAVLAIEGPKAQSEAEEDKAMRQKITDLLARMNQAQTEKTADTLAKVLQGDTTSGSISVSLEELRKRAAGGVSVKANMTPEEKEVFLTEHAVRQAKALIALGQHWIGVRKEEYDRLERQLAIMRKAQQSQ